MQTTFRIERISSKIISSLHQRFSLKQPISTTRQLKQFDSAIDMSQKAAPIKMEAPDNWLQMVENIRYVRKMYPAPVDSMGCDQASNRTDKTVDQRFQILLSLMLSSQTKDPITWAAVQKLKEAGLGNAESLLQAKEKDIEDLIYPVGFYRRKAVYLKKVAEKILTDFNGDIPNSVEALCTLNGVGPKMAHLCMQEAWNVNSGIGVDTHVHRISARLGWVPSNTKTPEQTRMALESWMPPEYWREINHLLVGFGQTICAPLNPKCHDCTNSTICPSAFSASSKRRAATTDEGDKTTKQKKRASVAALKTEPDLESSAKGVGKKSQPATNKIKRNAQPQVEVKKEQLDPLLESNGGLECHLDLETPETEGQIEIKEEPLDWTPAAPTVVVKSEPGVVCVPVRNLRQRPMRACVANSRVKSEPKG